MEHNVRKLKFWPVFFVTTALTKVYIAAKIFHPVDEDGKLVAGVSRVTTSHSVERTIQSSRIGGARRCGQLPTRKSIILPLPPVPSPGWNSPEIVQSAPTPRPLTFRVGKSCHNSPPETSDSDIFTCSFTEPGTSVTGRTLFETSEISFRRSPLGNNL